MSPNLRVLAGEKRQRFFGHVHTTNVLPVHHLVRIAGAQNQYSALLRAAALRNLIAAAPLEVTQGQPFSARRRLVRQHYAI